jgi:progesterone-induced-blocking factor 1
MEGLKIRTGGEIERVRTSIREMYERENTNLREAREMALAEKEAAALGEKRLVEQVAKLLEESKSTTIALDSKLADSVNSLRMKTFEHETLQVLYEKTLQLQKDLQVENDTLTKKLDTITKDHFLSKSVLDQANSGMAQELKSLKDKLAVYENLEKELDEVVLQCAEIDDEAQAEKVLFAYGYGTNVPSTAKRRMMQSVHLARRVLALERANVSQRRTIEKSEERLKALTEELGRANAAIEQSQQPYGYLVQTVKLKDNEVGDESKFMN